VIFVGGCLGRAVALALAGDDMDQHRPFVGVADILENLDQRIDVVAVDRPDIIEAELVEERAAGDQPARIFLHPRAATWSGSGIARANFWASRAAPDICSS
jgi:hypothetical protein